MTNLKQKTINGMIWTISERFSIQFLHLISSIILARILEPSEFGLIGMLSIFTAIGQTILDSGFGFAIIRKKDANQIDFSSVFFLNLTTGIILTIILYLSAPLIANFYNQPELVPLTRFLSLLFTINAFGFIQFTLFTKNLNFKKLFKISLLSVIISSSIGIAMAFLNMGVWSLAAQMISYAICRVLIISATSKWRPTYTFSLSSLKEMFPFGSKILVFSLIEIIFNNIYQTFIGKIYSATQLGYYTRAVTFQTAATQATSTSISRVIFPTMTPFQNDDNKLKQAFKKTFRMSSFIHFPMMIGLFVIADPLFRILLTDKWAMSIPYFQILCLVGLFYPQRLLNLNLINIKGRSGVNLYLIIFEKMLIILAILLTFHGGVISLLFGQLITTIIFFILSSYFSGRLVTYTLIERFKDIISIFIISLLMGLVIFIIGEYFNFGNNLKLLFQIILGLIFYLLISKLIKSPELGEYQKIALSILNHFCILLKKNPKK